MMDKIVIAKMVKMLNQKDQDRKIRIKINYNADELKPLPMIEEDRMQMFDQVFERLITQKKIDYVTIVVCFSTRRFWCIISSRW